MKRAPALSDRALLLRVSPYGESDVVVSLFTARDGVTPALARRARTSSPKKQAMVLEPFHTLSVELQRTNGELSILKTATLAVARTALLEAQARLDAAGLATRWTRALSPAHVAEPEVFAALEGALDALADGRHVEGVLATFGLALLELLGYGLELSACARCGRERPSGRAAYVSGGQGGVLCESCRRGATLQVPLIAGAVLDQAVTAPEALLDAADEELAPLSRAIVDAVESHARTLGARLAR